MFLPLLHIVLLLGCKTMCSLAAASAYNQLDWRVRWDIDGNDPILPYMGDDTYFVSNDMGVVS